MPSITSIFTAALRWLRGDVIRSARAVLAEHGPVSAGRGAWRQRPKAARSALDGR
jgi:hypothetical protein